MKREIKFRLWQDDHMFYNHSCSIQIGGTVDYQTQGGDWMELKEPCLMQFTGLKDCKGIDIYEGDIVEVDYNYRTTSKHTSPYVDKLVCKFTNGAFNFFYKGIERVLNVDTAVYSVIGNVFQSPELL